MTPEGRHPAIERLEVLVGVWDLELVFPTDPPGTLTGAHTTFEWMPGGQLLLQRTDIPDPDAPSSLLVYSYDERNDAYTEHYFDSRGVVRTYGMSFDGAEWKLWRDKEDFSALDFRQRFSGALTDGGNMIKAAWEICHDGTTWDHDFDITYRRRSG